MYCDHYGFTEKPFTNTPNPRFLFLSGNHREALAHLLYGIDNHCGFIELIGEVGTGKTTLLRTLLARLDDERHRSALVFNPLLSPLELLRTINREYGISWEGLDTGGLLAELNRFLLEQNRNESTVVLVIDEAQNLDPAVLEQVRLISNLETERDKLIQIILAGQPELGPLLRKPELRQLGQRVTVRYQLSPMDYEDTSAYIRHRIDVAGGWKNISFSRSALKEIFRFSGGVPRLINIAADRALLIGYTEDTREITGSMARGAVAEVRRDAYSVRRYLAAAAIAAAVLAVAAGILVSGRVGGSPRTAPAPAPAAETAPRPAPQLSPSAGPKAEPLKRSR
jgi:general secretion pathway protein A